MPSSLHLETVSMSMIIVYLALLALLLSLQAYIHFGAGHLL